jgi:hypothetical protein
MVNNEAKSLHLHEVYVQSSERYFISSVQGRDFFKYWPKEHPKLFKLHIVLHFTLINDTSIFSFDKPLGDKLANFRAVLPCKSAN